MAARVSGAARERPWVVRLPGAGGGQREGDGLRGGEVEAGGGVVDVAADLAFFNRGRRTERTWYYDLSDIKVGKRTPFTLAQMADFFRLLPDRGESERPWTVSRSELEARGLDLKAVNPHRKSAGDTRTPAEPLDTIAASGAAVAAALAELRGLLGTDP